MNSKKGIEPTYMRPSHLLPASAKERVVHLIGEVSGFTFGFPQSIKPYQIPNPNNNNSKKKEKTAIPFIHLLSQSKKNPSPFSVHTRLPPLRLLNRIRPGALSVRVLAKHIPFRARDHSSPFLPLKIRIHNLKPARRRIGFEVADLSLAQLREAVRGGGVGVEEAEEGRGGGIVGEAFAADQGVEFGGVRDGVEGSWDGGFLFPRSLRCLSGFSFSFFSFTLWIVKFSTGWSGYI